MSTIARIPRGRMEVLKNEKRIIEKMGGVKIKLRKESAEVIGKDPIKVMKTSKVIEAISYGFNPYDAIGLFRDDFRLAVYHLSDIVSGRKELKRQIARLIGEKGSAKRFFEKSLGIKIIVHGKEVFCLGNTEGVELFREALEKLVHGSPHSKVYKYVEMRLASLR